MIFKPAYLFLIETQFLSIDFKVMLPQERGGPLNLAGRLTQTVRRAEIRVAANHRMLNLADELSFGLMRVMRKVLRSVYWRTGDSSGLA